MTLSRKEQELILNFRTLGRQIAEESMGLPHDLAEAYVTQRIAKATEEVALISEEVAEAAVKVLRAHVAAHRAH